jgi:prevent-host-death family protein
VIKLKLKFNFTSSSWMTVSMLTFRKNAAAVLRRVGRGQRLILTYRGRPVARLIPLSGQTPRKEDPFYRLAELAEETGPDLSNTAIDRILDGA